VQPNHRTSELPWDRSPVMGSCMGQVTSRCSEEDPVSLGEEHGPETREKRKTSLEMVREIKDVQKVRQFYFE